MFLMPRQRKAYETFFKDPAGTLHIHSSLARGGSHDKLHPSHWEVVRDLVGDHRGRGYSGESLVSINQLVSGLTNLGGSFSGKSPAKAGAAKGEENGGQGDGSGGTGAGEGDHGFGGFDDNDAELETGSRKKSKSQSPLKTALANSKGGGYGGVDKREEHRRVFCDKFESIFKTDGSGQRFVEYKRRQFRKIREQAGIKDDDFVESLRTTKGLSFSEGASGQFKFFTGDGRYFVKTLTTSEKKLLVCMAEDLQQYWKHNRRSKLGRICEFRSIGA